MTRAAAKVWEGAPSLRRLLVPVESVVTHPDNPRLGDLDAVAASLRRFGQRKPIVVAAVDGHDLVFAGNHTLRAAAELLGWTHVAAVRGDDLPEEELEAYMVADNRTSDLGVYDDERLAASLTRLTESDRGLDGVGYAADDVDAILARLARRADEDAAAAGQTESRPGGSEGGSGPESAPREVVLLFGQAQYELFTGWLKMLGREHGTEGVAETVFGVVERAARAL